MSISEKFDNVDISVSPTRSLLPVDAAHREDPAKHAISARSSVPQLDGLSWFRLSLVAGGAVAVVALVLGSFFFLTDVDAKTGDVALNDQPKIGRTPPKKLAPFVPFEVKPDSQVADEPAYVTDVPVYVAPAEKQSPTVRHIEHAAYRPPRPDHRPHLVVSRFVPTTLIIYTQNGMVKTRREPQLTAAYKKQEFVRD